MSEPISDRPIWKDREKKQFEQVPQDAPKPDPSKVWETPEAEARFMVVFLPGRKMSTVVDGSFDLRKVRAILSTALKILDPLIAAQDGMEALAQQQEMEQQMRDAHALATLPLDGRN